MVGLNGILKMIIFRINLVVIISNMFCLLEFSDLKKSTRFTRINTTEFKKDQMVNSNTWN